MKFSGFLPVAALVFKDAVSEWRVLVQRHTLGIFQHEIGLVRSISKTTLCEDHARQSPPQRATEEHTNEQC